MDEKQTDGAKDFVDQAGAESRSILMREFWDFLKDSKKWWLTPIIVCLLLFGALVLLGGTAPRPSSTRCSRPSS